MIFTLEHLESVIPSVEKQIRRRNQEIQDPKSKKKQIQHATQRLQELEQVLAILFHQKQALEEGKPITQELTIAQNLAMTHDILETVQQEIDKDKPDFWHRLHQSLTKRLHTEHNNDESEQSSISPQKR